MGRLVSPRSASSAARSARGIVADRVSLERHATSAHARLHCDDADFADLGVAFADVKVAERRLGDGAGSADLSAARLLRDALDGWKIGSPRAANEPHACCVGCTASRRTMAPCRQH